MKFLLAIFISTDIISMNIYETSILSRKILLINPYTLLLANVILLQLKTTCISRDGSTNLGVPIYTKFVFLKRPKSIAKLVYTHDTSGKRPQYMQGPKSLLDN